MRVFSEPRRLGRRIDEAVLDHRSLGMHAHDLVAGWLIRRRRVKPVTDQLLDQLGARGSVLDQDLARRELSVLLAYRPLQGRRRLLGLAMTGGSRR
jgi:hypothetical protein